MNAVPAALDFTHRFIPATGKAVADARTILLLHGTGGNEHDLIDLGKSLAPDANFLSPRGKISEHGMPRFFRRLAEGIFDEADLIFRTHELADFIIEAASNYGFDPAKVTAVGYSNGANIAAGLLLLRPEILHGAVLLRAMVPLIPDKSPDLTGRQILLSSGTSDPILPIENARRLAGMFRDAGADLTFNELNAGHQLTQADVENARTWLSDQ